MIKVYKQAVEEAWQMGQVVDWGGRKWKVVWKRTDPFKRQVEYGLAELGVNEQLSD